MKHIIVPLGCVRVIIIFRKDPFSPWVKVRYVELFTFTDILNSFC